MTMTWFEQWQEWQEWQGREGWRGMEPRQRNDEKKKEKN